MLQPTNLTKEQIKNKKICAIDYGEKKVGLASTDIFHISFNPICTLPNDNKLIDNIINILITYQIDLCIIGFPIRKDNSITHLHEQILEFKANLETKIEIPFFLYDETLTTKEAKQNLINSGIPQKKRRDKKNLDKFAAMILLKNFIQEIEGF